MEQQHAEHVSDVDEDWHGVNNLVYIMHFTHQQQKQLELDNAMLLECDRRLYKKLQAIVDLYHDQPVYILGELLTLSKKHITTFTEIISPTETAVQVETHIFVLDMNNF